MLNFETEEHKIIQPSKYLSNFTPTQDLKLLWTKYYYPQSNWNQIANILKIQFSIDLPTQILKYRYQQYLNIPELKIKSYQEEVRQKNYDFIGKSRKSPEQFLQIYKQIKKYHERSNMSKREQTYEKQIIKKELYPDFQANIHKFQEQATAFLSITNIEQQYDILRYKETQELTEQEAVSLQKIQKIKFKIKQMRLDNQRKISKLYRVIRNIIEVQSKYFSDQIIINEININKYFIKILKNIYKNVKKIYESMTSKGYIKSQTANLALQSIENIERSYMQSNEKPFRKEIIKLYYFPNNEKTDKNQKEVVFETQDGQKITQKRLILILKMFRKVQSSYLKNKQKTQNQIIAEITQIQNTQFQQASIQSKETKKKVYCPSKSPKLKRPSNNDNLYQRQQNFNKRFEEKRFEYQPNIRKFHPQTLRQKIQQINTKNNKKQSQKRYQKQESSQRLSPIYKLDDDNCKEPSIIQSHPFHPPIIKPQTILMHGQPKHLVKKARVPANPKKKTTQKNTSHLRDLNKAEPNQRNRFQSKYSLQEQNQNNQHLNELSNKKRKADEQGNKDYQQKDQKPFCSPFQSPFDKEKTTKTRKKNGKKNTSTQKKIESYLSYPPNEANAQNQRELKEGINKQRKNKNQQQRNGPKSRLQKMLDQQILNNTPKNVHNNSTTKSKQTLLGFLQKYK